METAIRWSPSSTISEQRFLIADVNGRTFRHCRVDKYADDGLEYSTLSTQRKVPPFRAFDWSPHDENLVAIGQWSGEATVLRLNDESKPLSLPIRHQRLCNAVTFGHDALLATGLERVRNDFCLNIWDINRGILPSQSPSSPRSGSGRQTVEPLRKLASSEAITSIKFFSQPDMLVAGVKGICLRIYDLRESTGTASLQVNTHCVHNIAIDLLDENYFASAAPAKDSTIQIWDRRAGVAPTAGALSSGFGQGSQQGPVISYNKAFDAANINSQASVWSLRYCKSRSGILGALASTGGYKVYETKKNHMEHHHSYQPFPQSALDDSDMPQSMTTKQVHNVGTDLHGESANRQGKENIVAFDFSNLGGFHGRPCAITLRADQSVDIHELDGPPPALSLSSLGSLIVGIDKAPNEDGKDSNLPLDKLLQVISADEERFVPKPSTTRDKIHHDAGVSNHQFTAAEGRHNMSSREAHEHSLLPGTKVAMEPALGQSTVARRRCLEGYLFNCTRNADIVASDPWLHEMWTWIGRSKGNAADRGMIAQSIDFSFVGVFGCWTNDLGSQMALRALDGEVNLANLSIGHAIETLAKSLQLPEFTAVATSFPMHRQLCLHVCGFGSPYQQLEADVKELVQKGQNTKAAALAIIHDQPKLSFNALRNGKASSAHRELSLALAGFVKGNTDDTWDETVREIAKELDDPYARAILALVSYGDWHDVLAESSLPLKYRVGVALMYLDDAELTKYIENTTAECIKHGDIEGIILTGLTEQAVPLFQAYMLKFSDLQTPILALSFTSPRYFTDPLIDLWRETYRSLLNTYRLFIQRVQFDVQATKLSIRSLAKDGNPALAPAPRQVSLRCNNCDQALDRNPDHASTPSNGPQPQTSASIGNSQYTSIFGDAKSGTICPKCGRHMPRCVICMMWLGMPTSYPLNGGRSMAKSLGPKQPNSNLNGSAKQVQAKKTAKELMKDFIAVCRRCWHMSHGAHSEEWFERHDVCAVPGCDCRCVDLDGGRPKSLGSTPSQDS